ncbi:MAG: hypothetical protein WB630_13180 [Candidatus Acidiferrales bacterium]
MKEDLVNDNNAGEKMIRLDCAQFEEILHELDRPGTSGAALRESALGHAEGCSRCGALVTESEALDFALGQIADETSESQVPPKVEAALVREFRREKNLTASRRVRWQLAVLATAATILLALSFVMRRPQLIAPSAGNASSPGLSATRASSESPVESPALSSAPKHHSLRQKGNRAAPNINSNAVKTGVTDATEYATAYIPLPYAYDPSGLEGGSIVRVVLPRAALVSYGLPLEGPGVADQVTADMVVSEDGTPQAIRLVAQARPSSDF